MLATHTLKRYLQFCTAGLVGTAINYAVLYTLTEHLGLYYLFSAAVAFELALTANFFVDDGWTFRDRRKDASQKRTRFIRYNIGNLGGLAGNIATLWFVTEIIGFHYLVSNLFAIGVGSVLNFTASMHWAWKPSPHEDRRATLDEDE